MNKEEINENIRKIFMNNFKAGNIVNDLRNKNNESENQDILYI